MASSSPPRDAIDSWALPPKAHSSGDGSFSPAFNKALGFLDDVRDAGLVFAPAMPEPEAIQAAAIKAGISSKEALTAYLAILNYDG
mgnify:CR=1 FL=1